MTIAMMDEGSEFIVQRVCICNETGKRLADMGFTQGALGWIVRKGLIGGPLQVRLGDCDLMIRSSEAEGIDVTAVAGMLHGHGRHGGRWNRGRQGSGHGPGNGLGRLHG